MGFSLSVLQYFDIYHTVYAAMLKFPQDVQFRNCILRKYFNTGFKNCKSKRTFTEYWKSTGGIYYWVIKYYVVVILVIL